jgi:hypothetical protein
MKITKQLLLVMVLVSLTSAYTAEAKLWPFGKKEKAVSEQASPSKPSNQPAPEMAPSAEQAEAPPMEEPAPMTSPRVQVNSPLSDEVNGLKVEEPTISKDLPPDKNYVTVDDPKNPLGVTVSADKLNMAANLVMARKYLEAQKILVPLKDWLVDATEAHINLHKTLKSLPNAQIQSELEKQLALQFALLRDKSFFQIGMIGIGQKDYGIAVKNLSKVIQSQPRSAMGTQAYEVLQKIGFTEKIQLREAH